MSLLDHITGGEAGALYRRGMAAFNRGRDAEALEAFLGAAGEARHESDPVRLLARFYAGEAAARLARAALADGDPERALAHLEVAAGSVPATPDLACCRAAALLVLGRPVEALAAADEALELAADDLEGHALRALALHACGDVAMAAQETTWVREQVRVRRSALPASLSALLRTLAVRAPELESLRPEPEAVAPLTPRP